MRDARPAVLTRQLRITGRVQGVAFRDAMCDAADRLGVHGWVRNRRDGSVEALVQGSPESVEAMIAWARRGPPAARVTGVDAASPEPALERAYLGFERLPSA